LGRPLSAQNTNISARFKTYDFNKIKTTKIEPEHLLPKSMTVFDHDQKIDAEDLMETLENKPRIWRQMMQTDDCMGDSKMVFKKLADAVCTCIDEEIKYMPKIKMEQKRKPRP